ncbi:MAG: DUF4296 domain-containing protein [Cyclobacteriaceae bacterium]|nr:DUF4296 domain-containing protein [Cyclobacteriaceae bacterium HetDA_MAG_MS6]
MKQLHFLIFFILTACISKPEIPTGTLSKEKMSAILIDIHLLETKIDALRLDKDSARITYAHFENLILEKHEVDRETYLTSLKFYTDQTEDFYDIYEVVVDSLMLREKNQNIK